MKKTVLFFVTTLASVAAFAQDAGAQGSAGLVALGAGLAIGLAVIGGTMAQGKAASAALEGMARNPAASDKLFTPLILSLALIESLVILAFLVAFIKLPAGTFGF
jgi:F-type H+-transporting ATPase subunit c